MLPKYTTLIMRNMKHYLFALCLFTSFCHFQTGWAGTKNEIITCGDDKVLIFDADKSEGDNIHVLWEWKVSDASSQLPPEYQKLMSTLDECKSVDNNTKILLTSSDGGVVLVERSTKKCLFYAKVPMAHSAEMLPANKVAVALSTHPKGNSVEIYDISKPEQVLFRDSIYSGHGAVWMPEKERLYILGYTELRAYSLKDWQTPSPELVLERSWIIPVKSGHDLVRISDRELLVTGHEGVYCFNLEEEQFSPFEPLQKQANIKSVNYNKANKQLVYTQAEISWWTHHIYSRNPDKTYTINDINLYKVRVNDSSGTN